MKLDVKFETYEGVVPSAQEHVSETIKEAVEEAALRCIDQWADAVSSCESPIEEILLSRLMFLNNGYEGGFGETYLWGGYEIAHGRDPTKQRHPVVVSPQFEVPPYRLDFAVWVRNFNNDWIKIAIECDGHDFHEKTKEQAQRDKKRDRDLQAAGWRVFRFTGSEIYRDPDACKNEIENFLANWVEEDLEKRELIRGRNNAGDR